MNKLLINTATEFKEVVLCAADKWYLKSWKEQASDLEHILPNIEQLLLEANLQMTDLEEVIILQGPGSFTSLRLGVATANTLAQELELDLKVINTADYVTARLAEEPAYCLLKSGGKQVHVFKEGKYIEQIPLDDFIDQHKGQGLIIAADFTERLREIWLATEHDLEALEAVNWQPLGDVWPKMEARLRAASWPVVPEYFKAPSIS